MKINIQTTKKPTKKGDAPRPRKNALQGPKEKACFYIGDSLADLELLNDKLAAAKAKPVTQSFVFREGAKAFIKELISKTDSSVKGRLHAKIRKGVL